MSRSDVKVIGHFQRENILCILIEAVLYDVCWHDKYVCEKQRVKERERERERR